MQRPIVTTLTCDLSHPGFTDNTYILFSSKDMQKMNRGTNKKFNIKIPVIMK